MVSIFYLNKFNKNQVKSKFKEVTFAEGVTIQNLMEISGFHLAKEGEEALRVFLDRLYTNESIVYIGLFKGTQLIYLLSHFEGYFPVTRDQEEFRILDTPAGKIFEITGQFEGNSKIRYHLHIGFDYEFLTAFETAASRNFLIVAGLFSLVVLFIMALVFYFDRKFFQKELELVEEKQEKERFKELSLLTSEIAHEIKNPLNSIYLSFNTLEKYCTRDKDALFYRDAIKGEIKRISGILQDYSDLSKDIRPEIKDLDIKEFINEFRLIMEEEFKTGSIDFRMEKEGKESVRTDKNLLKQILLNLIKNALEADATKITVNLAAVEQRLIVEIIDNGKGIDEKIKPSIFKPYISSKTKGMGLGLHITRRLVQALHGEIQLVSHVPGNTIFRITLPEIKEGWKGGRVEG
jgi:signal transduction histidine kinase